MRSPYLSLLHDFFPRRLQQWLGPLAAAALLALVLGGALIWSGALDLAASVPHPAGWATLLHYTFQRSTAFHARGLAPPPDIDSAALIQKGAVHYDRACSHCHSIPGRGQNVVALAMRPQPQYLPQVAGDFTAPELFWIIKHGVKYSAMPAWPVQNRDDEVWALAAFVKQLPRMSADRYRQLVGGDLPGALPPFPPGQVRPIPYRPDIDTPDASEQRIERPVYGFGDAGADAGVGQGCIACHGVDGAGRPGGAFPNIALLTEQQIAGALTGYASGARSSGFMQAVATNLTPAQIAGLARYYAAQPKRQAEPLAPPAELRALGATIASRGDAAREVDACASCHEYIVAVEKAYPNINGQNWRYMRDQLKLFRAGVRGGTGRDNPMYAAARHLSDREIDAVALFYASRPPNAPRPPLASGE
ncbi:MAG: hypothetical protein A4S12_09175 [Proteobacteria bacterium SG_bin5]|nr:MAG: hypothetical protein A4S12_09175 [Proteobacteria bacterium SG_bin5]